MSKFKLSLILIKQNVDMWRGLSLNLFWKHKQNKKYLFF